VACSLGGWSNIEDRQAGQIVWVMPAADGGAVTTHRHQAQTTVNTRAAMAISSSALSVIRAASNVVRADLMNRNGYAGAPGGQPPA
jgi:hypothetical protein